MCINLDILKNKTIFDEQSLKQTTMKKLLISLFVIVLVLYSFMNNSEYNIIKIVSGIVMGVSIAVSIAFIYTIVEICRLNYKVKKNQK